MAWVLQLGAGVFLIVGGVLIAAFHAFQTPSGPDGSLSQSSGEILPSAQQASNAPHDANSEPSGLPKQTRSAQLVQPMSSPFQSVGSGGISQLVNNLVNLKPSSAELTDEQTVMAWKQQFQQLIQQGSRAVPAIREFLAKNVDFKFGPEGKQLLGYASARAAMIDALGQIGGAVAEDALADVLQNTSEPREIAAVAQNLDKLNPGVHQQQALDAARQALEALAQAGVKNRDTAPLFEVLHQYGGPNIASELESQANRWEYYSAISLAKLPDNAGIPSLVEIAAEQSGASPGAKAVALQMLAQVATQSPDAQAALLEQVRQGKLTPFNWVGLEPLLAGNQLVFQDSVINNPLDQMSIGDLKQTHVPFGNQSFYTAPLGALTVDQIDQRKALIGELLSATSDPFAIQTLHKAEDELSQRMFQLAASSK